MPAPSGPERAAPFSLRQIAVPAFGPSALASVGGGAVLPVLALSARELGASVSLAALTVVVSGVAELAAALPAGSLVARLGERRALVAAALVEAGAGLLAWQASSLPVYFAAMALFGATSAVFLLARMAYLAERAPVQLRARAMSTLGGVHRIGFFVGPLLAAPLLARWGTQAAFGLSAAASLAAALLAWRTVDLIGAGSDAGSDAGSEAGSEAGSGTGQDGHVGAPLGATGIPDVTGSPRRTRTLDVVRAHRRVLLTVGVGVLVVSAARAARVVAVPLWAEHVGLSSAQTSVVFGVAGGVEMLLFYPAGSVMDRFGRVWVAVPCVVVLGAGLLVLPLTSTLAEVGAVAVLLGLGNGLGSGIVMTLGADASPVTGRAQFLGVWRLLSLLGANAGPLLVGLVSGLAGLAAACVLAGAFAVAGGGWLARWLPEYDPRRTDRRRA